MPVPSWQYETNCTIRFKDKKEDVQSFIDSQLERLTYDTHLIPKDFFFFKDRSDPDFRYCQRCPPALHNRVVYRYYVKHKLFKVVFATKNCGKQSRVVEIKNRNSEDVFYKKLV